MSGYRLVYADEAQLAALAELNESRPRRSRPDAGYVVDCDYGGAWGWLYRPHEKAFEGSNLADCDQWYGDGELPAALLRDFDRWQTCFERAKLHEIPPGADGADGWSWRSFHAEGLRLAKRLKRVLGPSYVIIYSKPWEDRSCQQPANILIGDDGRVRGYVHVPKPRPAGAGAV